MFSPMTSRPLNSGRAHQVPDDAWKPESDPADHDSQANA